MNIKVTLAASLTVLAPFIFGGAAVVYPEVAPLMIAMTCAVGIAVRASATVLIETIDAVQEASDSRAELINTLNTGIALKEELIATLSDSVELKDGMISALEETARLRDEYIKMTES